MYKLIHQYRVHLIRRLYYTLLHYVRLHRVFGLSRYIAARDDLELKPGIRSGGRLVRIQGRRRVILGAPVRFMLHRLLLRLT